MRTKRFLIIGMALAIVILLIAISVSRGGSKAALNPCPAFLADIQTGKADEAYSFFTANARSLKSKSDWLRTASGLQKAYGKVVPVAVSSNTTLSDKKGTTLPNTAVESYYLNGYGVTYIATCYLTKSSDTTYQINAFNSYISQNGTD